MSDDLFGILAEVHELTADPPGLQVLHLDPDAQGFAVGGKLENQADLLADSEIRRWLQFDKDTAATQIRYLLDPINARYDHRAIVIEPWILAFFLLDLLDFSAIDDHCVSSRPMNGNVRQRHERVPRTPGTDNINPFSI